MSAADTTGRRERQYYDSAFSWYAGEPIGTARHVLRHADSGRTIRSADGIRWTAFDEEGRIMPPALVSQDDARRIACGHPLREEVRS